MSNVVEIKEVVTDVTFWIECAKCGEDLEAHEPEDREYSPITVLVEPCKTCMLTAMIDGQKHEG
jgi:hypothetical protein